MNKSGRVALGGTACQLRNSQEKGRGPHFSKNCLALDLALGCAPGYGFADY